MTRQISKSRSSAVVMALMQSDQLIRKAGFRAELGAIAPDADAGIIPDAFAVRHEIRTIDLIEVVDTNPIMRHKAARVADIAFALQDQGWNLVVVGYDSCGGLMFELPGELFSEAFIGGIMGDDKGNTIPAAMAAARNTATMTFSEVEAIWLGLP